jgi:hypothetical protein
MLGCKYAFLSYMGLCDFYTNGKLFVAEHLAWKNLTVASRQVEEMQLLKKWKSTRETENNIKVDVREMYGENWKWVELTQDCVQLWTLMFMLLKLENVEELVSYLVLLSMNYWL